MNLSLLSFTLGFVLSAIFAWALFRPASFRQAVDRYPRSEWPGRILLAICLPWAAYVQIQIPPIAGNPLFIKILLLLVPVSFILILQYMKELLSVRALGGFLLLWAAPLMKASRFHPSSLSVFVTLTAYLLVIVGMFWVLSPFTLRQWMERLNRSPRWAKGVNTGGFILGLFLILLALTAYS